MLDVRLVLADRAPGRVYSALTAQGGSNMAESEAELKRKIEAALKAIGLESIDVWIECDDSETIVRATAIGPKLK